MPTKIYTLNLGMQTLTLAEFSSFSNGTVALGRFQSTELLVDPGADASRPAQIRGAVDQLKKAIRAKSGPLNYALPSQSVFSRYLGVPGSSYEELNAVIAFEAQQSVPFPIDEVVWDYQALGSDKDGKITVALLAIKTDILSPLNESVAVSGFTVQTVDVATMALLNAYRYNYSEVPGCSLIIDIGARTTNLIFSENGKAFSRTVPIGGSTISAALAKEFGQTIESAERMKREKGIVGPGGAYAESEDPEVAKIAKLIRATLTRIHAEVARSISFYRANQGGSQPARTFLAGGTVRTPYLFEFFAEKLQMPVEFLNPFRCVSVAPGVNQDELRMRAAMMGEVVGLALRQLGNCPIEVNLRPPSVVRAQAISRRKPYLIAAALCLFLAFVQAIVYFGKASHVTRDALDALKSEVANLERWARPYDAVAKEQKALERVATQLQAAVAARAAWTTVLNELNSRLPGEFIWITQMIPLSNGRPVSLSPERQPPPGSAADSKSSEQAAVSELEIRGLYIQNPRNTAVIDEFVDNLVASPLFSIKDKNSVVKQRSNPDAERWAYGYRLILPLENPIPLQ